MGHIKINAARKFMGKFVSAEIRSVEPPHEPEVEYDITPGHYYLVREGTAIDGRLIVVKSTSEYIGRRPMFEYVEAGTRIGHVELLIISDLGREAP
jgi:hypothetical protein